MARPSHREKLLTEGLGVVHAQGYVGASVRDIVQAAGVPQGSFTNHFTSKEAFGLEVLDLYFEKTCEGFQSTLLNDSLKPLDRVAAYIDLNIKRLRSFELHKGCMYGNLAAEASDHSEPIRLRLVEIFGEIQKSIEGCLKAAIKDGDLAPKTKAGETAGFILSSLQGAILMAKTTRSTLPIERFRKILFASVLNDQLA